MIIDMGSEKVLFHRPSEFRLDSLEGVVGGLVVPSQHLGDLLVAHSRQIQIKHLLFKGC